MRRVDAYNEYRNLRVESVSTVLAAKYRVPELKIQSDHRTVKKKNRNTNPSNLAFKQFGVSNDKLYKNHDYRVSILEKIHPVYCHGWFFYGRYGLCAQFANWTHKIRIHDNLFERYTFFFCLINMYNNIM